MVSRDQKTAMTPCRSRGSSVLPITQSVHLHTVLLCPRHKISDAWIVEDLVSLKDAGSWNGSRMDLSIRKLLNLIVV